MAQYHRVLEVLVGQPNHVPARNLIRLPRSLLDRESAHLTGAPSHRPFESVEDADDVATPEDTADRDRTNDAVDPRSRPAPDQDSNSRSLSRHLSP